MSPKSTAFAVVIGGVCLLSSASASADAAGWFHSGGGVLGWAGGPDPLPEDAPLPEGETHNSELKLSPLLTFDLGVGTSEQMPFILGGYFRVQPVLGHGVDLALFARFATLGFQQDYIGFAFDAGAYQRFWTPDSTGFIGQAVLGLPLGLQLSAIGTVGSNDTFGFGGVLGLDLVRLTVSRKHLLEWWPNPRPEDAMFQTASVSSPPVGPAEPTLRF